LLREEPVLSEGDGGYIAHHVYFIFWNSLFKFWNSLFKLAVSNVSISMTTIPAGANTKIFSSSCGGQRPVKKIRLIN
jgi:hypothetical protein